MLGLFAVGAGLGASAPAQTPSSPLTRGIGIDQRLGVEVPKDVSFLNQEGKRVRFGELYAGRPIMLVPIFFACNTGCVAITEGLMKTLTKATRNETVLVGRDLDVVMLSIHPKETPALARAKGAEFLAKYNHPATNGAWHFLTGKEADIRRITDAVGFRYVYDEAKDRINHPGGIIFLTPEGKVSSYILGTQFPTKLVEADLKIAARNEIGQESESFLFGCVMLDPVTGKRSIVYQNVVRLAGVVTLIVLLLSIVNMARKYRREPLYRGGPEGGR